MGHDADRFRRARVCGLSGAAFEAARAVLRPPGPRVVVTASASALEILVERVVDALRARFDVTLETVTTVSESMVFPLPRELREIAPEADAGAVSTEL